MRQEPAAWTRLTISPPSSRGRRPPEPGAQLNELRFALRLNRAAEVEEDLEGGCTGLVEELKAARAGAVHVAGFFHGEHCCQLPPTDVHVECFRLDVEELAGRAE